MKHMISLTLAFFIFFLAQLDPCISSEKARRPPVSPDTAVEQLKTDLQLTKQALQEVRRDQLNYRMEKDLLKETYSSNVQTINIVIAIILGVITLIGILGVKSIDTIGNEKVLNERYQNWLKRKKEYTIDGDMPVEILARMPHERFFFFHIFDNMINDGLVTKDGNELKINKAIKKTLNAFASFLDGKGELDKDSDKMKVEIPESDNENESVENT